MEDEKVLSSRIGKSPVWQHFTKYTTGGQCIYCGQFLRANSSTSSLLSHLRAHHASKWHKIAHLYPQRPPVTPPKPRGRKPKQQSYVTIEETTSSSPPVKKERVDFKSPRTVEHSIITVKPDHQDGTMTEEIVIANLPFEIEQEPSTSHSPTVFASLSPSKKKKKKEEQQQLEYLTHPLIHFIVVDEMPLTITELEGFRHLMSVLAPDLEFPSQVGLRSLLGDKYQETAAMVKGLLEVIPAYSLSVSEWSDAVNGRNFMGITCNFIDNVESELKSVTIAFEEIYEDSTEEDLVQKLEHILLEWGLAKSQITSVTVMNILSVISAAFSSILGPEKILLCFAQSLNAIAKKPFELLPEVHALIDGIKLLTDYLKQGEEILVEDSEEGQQFWELVYSTNTTWKSIFNQMDRFVKYHGKFEMLLYSMEGAPPMLTHEVLREIKDVVKVYRPLKGVCDDICLEQYLSASKVIPLTQCLLASLEDTWPETPAGNATKDMIIEQINSNHANIEENEICAMATLLDPRFKKNYFKCSAARDAAMAKLKGMVATADDQFENDPQSPNEEGSIWKFHSKFVGEHAAADLHPLTVYLSSKVSDLRSTDPIKYFGLNHVDFRPTAERLFVSQATAVPAKKIFSESGCVLNNNWTSLPNTDLRKLMFISSAMFSGL